METVGNVTNTNFVTPMGIVSRTQDEDYTFLIRDAHGDVVETFTNGVRDTYSYDAFGNQQAPDTNDDNPLRYCGEYYDTESGLIYLRNRYYDPDLGRFINEDPIQDGLNWYAYCGNNPVNRVDPLGYAWTDEDQETYDRLVSEGRKDEAEEFKKNIYKATEDWEKADGDIKLENDAHYSAVQARQKVYENGYVDDFDYMRGKEVLVVMITHPVLRVGNHCAIAFISDIVHISSRKFMHSSLDSRDKIASTR